MASIRFRSHTSYSSIHLATRTHSIFGSSSLKRVLKEDIRLRFAASFRMEPSLKLKASAGVEVLAESIVIKEKNEGMSGNSSDPFNGMKQRKNLKHFEVLAKYSRVCPSIILGFELGEAFILRNVANLVPPFEKGPSETNAALEFAVNALEVENILVIGHSCCGGIHALMSMKDKADSRSFISNWVIVGKTARENTRAAASTLGFDQQCRHCEKGVGPEFGSRA
ncbi:Beta carbonic anhydrase 5, chloroplastic-like protein [Drosera capensis]